MKKLLEPELKRLRDHLESMAIQAVEAQALDVNLPQQREQIQDLLADVSNDARRMLDLLEAHD